MKPLEAFHVTRGMMPARLPVTKRDPQLAAFGDPHSSAAQELLGQFAHPIGACGIDERIRRDSINAFASEKPSYLLRGLPMGYGTQLYGVDLAKLRDFYGSKNEATLAAIFESMAEQIADINDRFEDRIDDFDDDWPMTEDVLAEICAGNCIFDNAAPVYGYVLEILCRYFGEDILDDDLGPLKMHPYKSALLEDKVPIPIPTSHDFPGIGFIDPVDVSKELALVESTAKPDDEMLAEDTEIYRRALIRARDAGQSIVAFYY